MNATNASLTLIKENLDEANEAASDNLYGKANFHTLIAIALCQGHIHEKLFNIDKKLGEILENESI